MTKSNFRIPEVSNFRAHPSHTTEFCPPAKTPLLTRQFPEGGALGVAFGELYFAG